MRIPTLVRSTAVLAASAALLSAGMAPAASDEAELELPPLSDTVNIPFGFAIDNRETTGAAAELMQTHATQFTPENHMKPYAWYSGPDQFSPSPIIDTLMSFASDSDLDIHGHTLVWHSQSPDWFFDGADGEPLPADDEGREILRQRMETHIFDVAEYLADEHGLFGAGNPIISFDVVNEVVSDRGDTPGGLRESEWFRILGEDFIDLAFQYADEAFNETYAAPGSDRPVALYINDYSTEWPDKRARYHALIKRLLDRDVPVDVVGHQFHVHSSVSVQQLDDTLTDFEDLDVEQAVTEFDRPTGTPVTDERLQDQADFYRDAFQVFADTPSVRAITVWGLTDDRSWLADDGAPLLFDAQFQPKPAAFAVATVERISDEPAEVESIAVTQMPTTIEYTVGDELDLAGLEVTSTWTDSATEVLTSDEFTVTGFDSSVAGDVTLMVTLDSDASITTSFDVTVSAAPVEIEFTDVTTESSEFYDEIVWLASRGITEGWETEAGTEFRPFSAITRDAMAAFLYRYAGEPTVDTSGESPFIDITRANTEFYEEIVWLSEQGITEGWETSEGTEFRPFEPITRDAMAAFLYRMEGKPAVDTSGRSPFVDITPNNTEFYPEITWLESTGITEGWVVNGEAEYRPFHSTTRDAMAAFLYRFDQLPK
ncbi:endo-1,4-beta-xylanase [Demequina sp. SO4-13]|uniref:endo-1,4-beta-xylanase n=1 Tax=Demequina sp. SO4-13 TaxID=3401027 RepID=UPI003AF81586